MRLNSQPRPPRAGSFDPLDGSKPRLDLDVKSFALGDLAEALLHALEKHEQAAYVAPLAQAIVQLVLAQFDDRKELVTLARDVLESKSPAAYRSLAEAILGTSEPDVSSDLFTSAAEYFAETSFTLQPAPPPVESNPREPLPFTHLSDPKTFEHLCWEWLAGLMPEHAVFIYGRSGHAQHGVDIVAMAPQKRGLRGRNRYFQCKLYQDFTKPDLVAAVEKFEEGLLVHKARSFAIVAACQVLAPDVVEEFGTQAERLKTQYDIGFRLIDAGQLTLYLATRRDLIHKYFGKAHDRAYLQPKSEDPDSYMGAQLYTLGGGELFPDDLDIGGTTGLLIAKNPDVNLQVTYPDLYSNDALCGAITLRMLNHMQIGLAADDIRTLFSQVHIKLEDRPFIRGIIDDSQTTTTMMIGNCRIYPSVRMAQSFADAIDACHDSLIGRLRDYDQRYETEGLQLVRSLCSGNAYRIAALDPLVWECICDAVDDPEWSFPRVQRVARFGDKILRVHTAEERNGSIPYVEFIVDDDKHWPRSLSVMWKLPPVGIYPDYQVGWWGALTSTRWIADVLVPRAVEHREKHALEAWQRRPRWYAPFRKHEVVIIPRFETYIDKKTFIERLFKKADDIETLVTAVERLQSYLAVEQRTWDAESRRRIVTTLLIALYRAELQPHNLNYIRTTIINAGSTLSHAGLITYLESDLARSATINRMEADFFLRALLELLEDTPCALNSLQIHEISELLSPFARVHDDKLRLALHTPEGLQS